MGIVPTRCGRMPFRGFNVRAAGFSTAAEAVVGSLPCSRCVVRFSRSLPDSAEPLTANALVRRGDAIVSTAGKADTPLAGRLDRLGWREHCACASMNTSAERAAPRRGSDSVGGCAADCSLRKSRRMAIPGRDRDRDRRGPGHRPGDGDDAGADLGCAAARPGCGVRSNQSGRSDRRTGVARARNLALRTHAADTLGRAASDRYARACHVQLVPRRISSRTCRESIPRAEREANRSHSLGYGEDERQSDRSCGSIQT